MKKQNFTTRLRQAIEDGHQVVCSVRPYEGWLVEYKPRSTSDPAPWLLVRKDGQEWKDERGFRWSGRFCHAIGA